MTTTTTNIALTEPSNNTYVNTWDVPMNNNSTILDQVFGNTTSVSVSTSGTSTYTNITAPSSSAAGSTSQCMRFLLTGALSANQTVLIPQNIAGMWVVTNSTTGAFTVTIGSNNGSNVSAGASVAVPQGYSTVVYSDGTNVKLSNDGLLAQGLVSSFSTGTTGLTPSATTTGAVTLSGTLGVPNGGTGSYSLALNNLLVGNNTGALQVIAPTTTNNVLKVSTTSASFTGGISSTTGAIFVGSITGNTLTVSSVTSGTIAIGQILTGAGVTSGTNIIAGSGTTWTVSPTYGSPITSVTFTASVSTLTVSGVTGTIAVGQVVTGTGVTSGTTITSGSGSSWTVTPYYSGSVGPVAMTSAVSTWTSQAPIAQSTVQTLTTQTSVPFTSIPSWVKRITLMFSGMATTGSNSNIIVQLGTGSTPTYATSGYAGGVATSNAITTSFSSSFIINNNYGGGSMNGQMIINNLGSNTWVESSVLGISGPVRTGAGSVSLSDVLTALRLTTVSGDTFSAGSVNILYE